MQSQNALEASDMELLEACRAGDSSQFALLWERHQQAGRVAARNLAPGLDADDLVSEAYLKIFSLVRSGKGPSGAFRPYLYQTIKTVAADMLRSPEDATANLDEVPEFHETGPWEDNAFDLNATAQAFASLPERWQSVLWYTEVEGMPPRKVAPLLGISANGVSALAVRAREGLQAAWVAEHLNMQLAEEECRGVLESLQRYQRGKLTAGVHRNVEAHLQTCANCAAAAVESRAVSQQLALVLAIIFVGGGSAAALTNGIFGGSTPTTAAAATHAGGGAARRPSSGSGGTSVGKGASSVSATTSTGLAAVFTSPALLIGAGIAATLVVAITTAFAIAGLTGSASAEADAPPPVATTQRVPTERAAAPSDSDESDDTNEELGVEHASATDNGSGEETAATTLDPIDPTDPAYPVEPPAPIDGDPALAPTNTCVFSPDPAITQLNGDVVGAGTVRLRIWQNGMSSDVNVDFNAYEFPIGNWRWETGGTTPAPWILTLTPLTQWGLVDADISTVTVEARFIDNNGDYSTWTDIDTSVSC